MKTPRSIDDIIREMNDLAKAQGRYLGKAFWEIPPQPGSLLDVPETPQSQERVARLRARRLAREQRTSRPTDGQSIPSRPATPAAPGHAEEPTVTAQDLEVWPIVATTHQVRDTILTVEALYSMAACINERDRKPVMLAEHDILCPPMGQTVAARVVPTRDGHHALMVEFDFFPAAREIALPAGEHGFLQHSAKHRFPFTTGDFHFPSTFSLSLDPTGLGGHRGASRFNSDLRQADPTTEFEFRTTDRRSVLPDPEIVFTLGLQASALWCGVRLAKAAADAIEPELKAFFGVLVAAVKRMAVEAIPKNRPVTYVLQVHGKPNLEFIARTRDVNAVISAMVERHLGALQPQIDALHEHFNAEMIQFNLQENGTWAFNYLLTGDGKVIGTKKAFDHRAVVLQEMDRKPKGKSGRRSKRRGNR